MAASLIELVAGLPPDAAREVLDLGAPLRVPSGGTLFRLGEAADRLFIIERGRIALTMPLQVRDHEEGVFVEERLPGEIVGWSAFTPPHRFTLSATAPLETDLLAIPRTSLAEYLEAHPAVGYAVARNLAEALGRRLLVFQAMWLREMQHALERRMQPWLGGGAA